MKRRPLDTLAHQEPAPEPSMIREGAVYTGFKLLGKGAGFVREWFFAYFFGASLLIDAYRIATDLVQSLFLTVSGSALENSTVPFLARWRVRGRLQLRALMLRTITLGAVGFSLVLAVLMGFFARDIARLQAPGYSAEGIELIALMVRWMGPSLVLLVASSTLTLLLFSLKRVRTWSTLGLTLNIAQVIGAVAVGLGGLPVFILPLSYLTGLAFTLTLLVVDARRWWPRERARMTLVRAGKVLRPFLVQFLPLTIMGAMIVLRFFVEKRIASGIAVGAISAMHFARFIIEMPQGTLGESIIRLALPHFSELIQRDDSEEIRRSVTSLLGSIFWAITPVAVFVAASAMPLVRVLFGYGAFNEHDVALTTQALIGSTPALLLSLAYPVITRLFVAQGRSPELMVVSVLGTGLNIALAWLLAARFGIGGIPLAFGLTLLILILVLVPRSGMRFTGRTLFLLGSWLGWGVLVALLIRALDPAAAPVVTLLRNGTIVLALWLISSGVMPGGRDNLRRIVQVVKRTRERKR